MKLFDILKQFKNIEPDAQFTERSKRTILATPQSEPKAMRGIFIFLHALEGGAAVVLAGFFILILTGSFSGTHSIAPIQYAVIDPQGLHAEADAIDMQIQLASVDYPQVSSTGESTSPTAVTPAGEKTIFSRAMLSGAASSTATSTDTGSGTASSTSSSTLSIDQALQKLSQ